MIAKNVTFFWSKSKKNVLVAIHTEGINVITILVPRNLKVTPYQAYDVDLDPTPITDNVYRVLRVNKVADTSELRTIVSEGLYGTIKVIINGILNIDLTFWGEMTPYDFYEKTKDLAKARFKNISDFTKWKMCLQSLSVVHELQWGPSSKTTNQWNIEEEADHISDEDFDAFEMYIPSV